MATIINDAPAGSSILELVNQVNAIIVDLTALKTTFEAHTHGGVTAGGAATAVPSAAFITGGGSAFVPTSVKITLLK